MPASGLQFRYVLLAASLAALAGAVGASVSGAEKGKPQPINATPAELDRWIRDLDADDFLTREEATSKLIAAGTGGIELMQRVLPDGSLEVKTRVLYVLQELALADSDATEDAARTALESIAKPRETALAQQAAAMLAGVNEQRKGRAAEQLIKLGAKLDETVRGGLGFGAAEFGRTVEIGTDWTGTERDLKKIKWLGDSPPVKVILRGPQVTDEWVKMLEGATGIQALQLKRTKVTPEGLKVISTLPRLSEVAVYYSPLSDAAIPVLAECDQLAVVKLYDTKVTREAATRLQEALKAGMVDFRQGGFLGVGCQDIAEGCQVYLVQKGSAAEQAGIQQGDVILKMGGKPVTEFKQLTAIISQFRAGDEIDVDVLRGDERIGKKIKLGEWE